jgi:hypothetical protein
MEERPVGYRYPRQWSAIDRQLTRDSLASMVCAYTAICVRGLTRKTCCPDGKKGADNHDRRVVTTATVPSASGRGIDGTANTWLAGIS